MSSPVRKAIFPVGGLGTRFLPATKAMPKELLPIVDGGVAHCLGFLRRQWLVPPISLAVVHFVLLVYNIHDAIHTCATVFQSKY